MSDISYIFPQHCCVCMGTPDTTQLIRESKTIAGIQTNAHVDVPICSSCKQKRFRGMRKRIGIVLAVVLIPGLLIGMLAGKDSNIETWGGGLVGFLLSALFAGWIISIMQKQLPVKIKLEWQQNPTLEFENKEYQDLFRKANGH